MSRTDLARDLVPSPWEFLGFLAYLVALTTVLVYGFLWSLRFPEFAMSVLPIACLAILWDDQRRDSIRHAMPLPLMDAVEIIDPLWDREIDS